MSDDDNDDTRVGAAADETSVVAPIVSRITPLSAGGHNSQFS
jgi:hypothetical protein